MSNVPQTPPRLARNQASIRSPNLHTPARTPVREVKGLFTPSTTSKQKSNLLAPPTSNLFKTPSSIKKKPTTNAKNVSLLLPITPEFTPQRSPSRGPRKRKFASNELFKHTSDTQSGHKDLEPLSFGLLLPAPSTVGSGRASSSQTPGSRAKPDGLKLDTLARLNSNLQFEEDDEDIAELDSKMPLTPKKQMIDEQMVDQWHGKSYHNMNYSSEDELSDSDLSDTKLKMANPFLESNSPIRRPRPTSIDSINSSNPFTEHPQNKNVDYNTHMELVNHRTGQRRVVKLTNKQMQVKPKKLDFSNV